MYLVIMLVRAQLITVLAINYFSKKSEGIKILGGVLNEEGSMHGGLSSVFERKLWMREGFGERSKLLLSKGRDEKYSPTSKRAWATHAASVSWEKGSIIRKCNEVHRNSIVCEAEEKVNMSRMWGELSTGIQTVFGAPSRVSYHFLEVTVENVCDYQDGMCFKPKNGKIRLITEGYLCAIGRKRCGMYYFPYGHGRLEKKQLASVADNFYVPMGLPGRQAVVLSSNGPYRIISDDAKDWNTIHYIINNPPDSTRLLDFDPCKDYISDVPKDTGGKNMRATGVLVSINSGTRGKRRHCQTPGMIVNVFGWFQTGDLCDESECLVLESADKSIVSMTVSDNDNYEFTNMRDTTDMKMFRETMNLLQINDKALEALQRLANAYNLTIGKNITPKPPISSGEKHADDWELPNGFDFDFGFGDEEKGLTEQELKEREEILSSDLVISLMDN